MVGKFLTDPVWWFYIYWLPKFLNQRFGLDLAHLGLPLIVIYTMTGIGSVGGGWFSGALIKRGASINKGRKTVMLISALLVVPIVFASTVPEWWAVLLIGIAAAAHQSWSANLFTTVSDMFPKKAVGSVVGLGGMAGAVSGVAGRRRRRFYPAVHRQLSIVVYHGGIGLPVGFICHQLACSGN